MYIKIENKRSLEQEINKCFFKYLHKEITKINRQKC
jgi:hypothetical protein